MHELGPSLVLSVVGLATVGLVLWRRARRFAHVPWSILILAVGALVSLRLGGFLRATALQPERYRCGDPFFIPLMGLLMVAGVTVAFGAALTAWKASRQSGRAMLIGTIPLFLLICVLCGLIGRYGPSSLGTDR